jgi:hypothetical protein
MPRGVPAVDWDALRLERAWKRLTETEEVAVLAENRVEPLGYTIADYPQLTYTVPIHEYILADTGVVAERARTPKDQRRDLLHRYITSAPTRGTPRS